MSYPTEGGPVRDGGLVSYVVPGGPAERAGLAAGELVLLVDGQPLRDILDWLWHADASVVTLRVRAEDGSVRELEVVRSWDEPWGLTFAGVVFDGIRECENACMFCFISQLASGLRPSLYVRDDDFRLSFLTGNFVTLTNVDDDDAERIVTQRLSPLHVSLHAIDEDVRRRLLCPTVEDRALEMLDRLLGEGIEFHVQIVLVPGINDGAELRRTLAWLAERPGVLSVGVVPVGFTGHGSAITESYDDPAAARAVLDELRPWRELMAQGRGTYWVHAADEFYLNAGVALPPADAYDDFPQYENGIGMVRSFIDDVDALDREAVLLSQPVAVATLVTGTLFAPVLESLVPSLETFGVSARVLAVENRLLGGNVSVAGLLAGSDIADALIADLEGGDGPYLVPDVAVNDHGVFIDDVSAARLCDLTRKDVRLISCDAAGLASALRAIANGTSG